MKSVCIADNNKSVESVFSIVHSILMRKILSVLLRRKSGVRMPITVNHFKFGLSKRIQPCGMSAEVRGEFGVTDVSMCVCVLYALNQTQ